METDQRAIVVGAGVIGLTTAVGLLDAGWHVRIVTSQRPEQTTSAVSAAVWYPYGVAWTRVSAWAARSYAAYLSQVDSAPGVRLRQGWELFRARQPIPPWAPVVGGITHASPEELPAGYVDAHEFTTVVVEMPVYLRWLVARVARAGGTFEQRTVGSLTQLREHAALVVNCSGLGARQLAGDRTVVPVRGQIVRVTNPGLRRFIRDNAHPEGRTYVYPRTRDCVLGGTAERDSWDIQPDAATTDRILRVCRTLEPALADAEVIEPLVGLRPWRPDVRLAVESGERGVAGLIHNYGHGGAGVTLAWGCAGAVVELAARATARRS